MCRCEKDVSPKEGIENPQGFKLQQIFLLISRKPCQFNDPAPISAPLITKESPSKNSTHLSQLDQKLPPSQNFPLPGYKLPYSLIRLKTLLFLSLILYDFTNSCVYMFLYYPPLPVIILFLVMITGCRTWGSGAQCGLHTLVVT